LTTIGSLQDVAGLPQPGDIWNDRYEVATVLGRGGFGRVYRAWDRLLERDVAIKMLRPSEDFTPTEQRRFRRETNIAANLDHPHIVTVYDGGERDGLLYLVMRFVAGHDLRYELADGALSQRRAISIVRQIGSALDHAHDRGLVHRDIKPGNILCLADTDTVYLTDFGISRPVDQTTDNPVTQGLAPATRAYAAPEQMRTGARVDGRTDVYALGCVLYECLTGRKPFDGELAAMVNAHLNDAPPKVSAVRADLSGDWDAVIATAMAKDPAQRFHRCATLTAAAEGVPASSGRSVAKRPAASSPPNAGAAPSTEHVDRPSTSRSGQTQRFERAQVRTQAIRPPDDAGDDPPTDQAPVAGADEAPGPTTIVGDGVGAAAVAPHPSTTAGRADARDDTRSDTDPQPPTPSRTVRAAGTAAGRRSEHADDDGDRGDGLRGPAFVVVVVATLVVLGLIWAIVQGTASDPGGSSGSGEADTAGGGALNAELGELLNVLGAYDEQACRPPTREPLAGEQVAISCADDAQTPTRVVFRRFGSQSERDDAFEALARTAGDGDCSVDRRATHTYTGDAGSGRVVCAVDNSTAGLSWTVPDGPFMGSARLDDPAAADELYAWWSEVVQRSDR
jgi:serine/threonine protein kinase